MAGRRRAWATRGLALVLLAAAPLAAAPSAAAVEAPTISFPAPGEEVDAGVIAVRGTVSGADDDRASVVYAVDVSGSTSARGYDCNSSGTVDEDDDLNGDGSDGEVLDCEIAGVVALNQSLSAVPGAAERLDVALVPFGSRAEAADVSSDPGEQRFVRPTAGADGRDSTADIVQAAGSLDQALARLFTPRSLGTATNINAAVTTSLDLLEGRPGRRVVFLLTDGIGSVSQATLERLATAGVEVRPFAITSASDGCRAGGTLARIGEAGGVPCRYVEDPATLSASLSGGPEDVAGVEVILDGGPPVTATLDPLGNFTANVAAEAGPHAVQAVSVGVDGSRAASPSVNFTAAAGLRFVALGDSYSAGEGIRPYRNVPPGSTGCHQSAQGYALLVGLPGQELPGGRRDVQLDYLACSGADLRHLTTERQNARGAQHIVQLDRVGPDADLVAVSIGGNDAAFSEVLDHCARSRRLCQDVGFARLTSGRTLSLEDFLRVRLALLEPELGAFYRTLVQRTGDQASIVALNYPETFDDGIALRLGCAEDAFFPRRERQFLNQVARDLGAMIRRQASVQGIWTADVIPEFRGHRVCEGGINTQSEWIVGIDGDAARSRQRKAGDASFHPDADGARAYARVLTTFLRDRVAAGVPLTREGLPANPGSVPTPTVGVRFAAYTAAAAPAPAPDPAPAVDGFGAEELAEIAAMRFGDVEVQSLSALRGETTCLERAALGEQVVVTGRGFQPGSQVRATAQSPAEEAPRVATSLVADGRGQVTASVVVPHDLAALPDAAEGDPSTVLGLTLEGIHPGGGLNRLSTVLPVDPPDGPCTAALGAAGDLAPASGGPAPSAARSAAPGPLLTLPLPGEDSALPQDCTIVGTPGSDLLIGTPGDDVICGGAGDDRVQGMEGNDRLRGGDGADVLDGGPGADEIAGEGGNDQIDGGSEGDTLNGGDGDDQLDGGTGLDRLDGGTGLDQLDGGSDNDQLDGGDGNDRLEGGFGTDALLGGSGADLLNGQADADRVAGGPGDDLLLGGSGTDELLGDGGDDTLDGGPDSDACDGGEGRDEASSCESVSGFP